MHSKIISIISPIVAAVIASTGCNASMITCIEREEIPPQVIEAFDGKPIEKEPVKLLDVNMDAETQQKVFEVCGGDKQMFCVVMAIAEHESGFLPNLVNYNGRCKGITQVDQYWNAGRMKELGVTDLFDPVQCITVSVDILQELQEMSGEILESPFIYMAYNMGYYAAKRAYKQMKHSTAYSSKVLKSYYRYMNEIKKGMSG